MMKKAMFWESKPNKAVQCVLCAHNCKINDGKTGICRVRINKAGVLYTLVYGLVSPGMIDPIEKKPLFNFSQSMSCSFCCICLVCNFRHYVILTARGFEDVRRRIADYSNGHQLSGRGHATGLWVDLLSVTEQYSRPLGDQPG